MSVLEPAGPPPAPRRRPSRVVVVLLAVSGLLAAVLVVAASLLLGNAIQSGPQAAASASPASMDSPQSIAHRLDQLGIGCGSLTPISDPSGATARASCHVGGDEVVISTYLSRADVDAQWQLQSALVAGITDMDMVLGDTWTLSCDDPAYAQKAADLLDAEYRHS